MSAVPATSYPQRLAAAVRLKGAPLALGLDPHPERIPPCFRGRGPGKGTARAMARAYLRWAEAILPAAAPYVAAVKIQAAFYEEAGWPGVWALEETVSLARDLGLLVILDVKRGDVPSTAAAYARAWLDGPAAGDAITLYPWLGTDSLEPFFERARTGGRGLYLLVLTSNPGARELQELPGGPVGEPLYRVLARQVAAWSDRVDPGAPWSSVGAVVAANRPDELAALRALMPRVPFLLPGVGAQGGQVADLGPAFGRIPGGGLVTASRSILFGRGAEAVEDDPSPEAIARGVARSAREMRDAVAGLVARVEREEAERGVRNA